MKRGDDANGSAYPWWWGGVGGGSQIDEDLMIYSAWAA